MGIKSSVSLYSFQYQFMHGAMNLDQIIDYVMNLGTEGIELIPDQMLMGTPTPSDETYAEWDRLMEKYHPRLSCDDIFLNTNLYLNRELTKRECIALINQEIVMAHRLGFHVIRMVSSVPAWILEPCLETAEKYDICLCFEVHGGLGFEMPKTEALFAEMIRLNSPYVGMVPDMSLFCRRPPRIIEEFCVETYGTNPDLIKYVRDVFANGGDTFRKKVANGGSDPDMEKYIKDPAKDLVYANSTYNNENRPMSVLDPYVDYIKHFHFKFFEMTEEGTEYSMDYDEAIKYLHEHNYDGFISSEYEGNRWILPGNEIPEKEQVAANQKLIQSLIQKYEG